MQFDCFTTIPESILSCWVLFQCRPGGWSSPWTSVWRETGTLRCTVKPRGCLRRRSRGRKLQVAPLSFIPPIIECIQILVISGPKFLTIRTPYVYAAISYFYKAWGEKNKAIYLKFIRSVKDAQFQDFFTQRLKFVLQQHSLYFSVSQLIQSIRIRKISHSI